MQSSKPLTFDASAGEFFVLTIISIVLTYIPFLGWAYLLNYSSAWMVDHATINGQKAVYKAGYGESLRFIFVNTLLIMITLGIYIFWFYPKLYRYVTQHIDYMGAEPAATQPLPQPVLQPTVAEPSPPEPPVATPTPSNGPTPPAAFVG